MDPIQPKENVDDDLQQNDSCVTVDEFRVLMKEAQVKLKEKLEKKKIYELIGVLDGKLMDVDNKGKSSHLFLNIGNFPFVFAICLILEFNHIFFL
jgi:hypothetical protein